MTRQEIFLLRTDECDALAKGLSGVAVAYGWTDVADPKTMALLSLGLAMAGVYGPRIMMLRELRKQSRAKPVNAAAPEAEFSNTADTSGISINLSGFN